MKNANDQNLFNFLGAKTKGYTVYCYQIFKSLSIMKNFNLSLVRLI